jgi:serine/threonine protein kinase
MGLPDQRSHCIEGPTTHSRRKVHSGAKGVGPSQITPWCPDVVQSFLRCPDGNFLSFCSGGTLDQRLRNQQLRDGRNPSHSKLLVLKKKESVALVEQWIMELANAAAWLESFGLAHTDIRPPNLLLHGQDHLKLADFNCIEEVGTRAAGGAPPLVSTAGQ